MNDKFHGESDDGGGAKPGAPGGDTWPTMDPGAFHGLAGEIVSTMAPQTEADPVALLLQFLVYFGNAVGRGPYYLVNRDASRSGLGGRLPD